MRPSLDLEKYKLETKELFEEGIVSVQIFILNTFVSLISCTHLAGRARNVQQCIQSSR